MVLPHQLLLSTTKRIGPLQATDETNTPHVLTCVPHVVGQALDAILDMSYYSDTHIASSPARLESTEVGIGNAKLLTPARRR
jgi:hypothetical protein